jgi:hypothetical protein
VRLARHLYAEVDEFDDDWLERGEWGVLESFPEMSVNPVDDARLEDLVEILESLLLRLRGPERKELLGTLPWSVPETTSGRLDGP